MTPLTVGVLALQGDVSEHVEAFRQALSRRGGGEVLPVRRKEDISRIDALSLPGGESTTISKLLTKSGVREELVRRARQEDLPLLGTCAGLILLSQRGDRQVTDTRTELLGLMEMEVNRNAFGRQRESFEARLHVEGVGEVTGAFIRAPAIVRTWGDCRVVSRLHLPDPLPGIGREVPVAAFQGNRWALAFHPELTRDDALLSSFLDLVDSWKKR